MNFQIEQIALCPKDPQAAVKLLTEMGLDQWVLDQVVAIGYVHSPLLASGPIRNEADLFFNYQGFSEKRELEVLHYTSGDNWMAGARPRVSHLGMHCSHKELCDWKAFFAERGVAVAQEVNTWSHNNVEIAGKRWYHYCIFSTYDILGVDIKFIVRRNGQEA